MKTHFIISLALAITPFLTNAQSAGYDPLAHERAEATMADFIDKNEKFQTYFDEAYGYIIFPSVGKGGSVIGGARGSGTVYEAGQPIGKATLTQITLGFQFGGQAYSQVIFFESQEDLDRFKADRLEFAGEASAVAVKSGAGASLNYHDGVAVFTRSKAGLMYQAALGGQKLKFKEYEVVN